MGEDVLYSGYSEDYPAIFDGFDAIIATRVHGCGLASSMGIPNALMPHDKRFETALKFQSHIVGPNEELTTWAESLDVPAAAAKLQNYRTEREDAWRGMLTKHLGFLKD